MKKFITTVSLILSFAFSHAQFTKGSFVVGGSTNLSGGISTSKTKSGSTTTTNGKLSSFSIEPQAGYFVIDNLAAGAGLSISASGYKVDGSSDKFSSTSISFTPFARYYYEKFYIQGSVGFGSTKFKDTINNTTDESKVNIGSWGLLVGYTWFISPAIALEPQLGYSSISRKDGSDSKLINSGLAFGIGLYGYISR